MIELNNKTQQDFLNRAWVQRLLDAGVDMSDAKYYISYEDSPIEDRSINCIRLKSELKDMHPDSVKIAMSIGAFERRGYINYEFDTLPTYTVSELLYKLHEYGCTKIELGKYILVPIIEYLASLLIQYHKKDIGIPTKDTGNISDK